MSDPKKLTVQYFCKICNSQHTQEIVLPTHSKTCKYPIPCSFTHLNEFNGQKIFTIIYLTEQNQIRNVISKKMKDVENNPLLKELIQLETDFNELNKKYKESIHDLKQSIQNLQEKNEPSQ